MLDIIIKIDRYDGNVWMIDIIDFIDGYVL